MQMVRGGNYDDDKPRFDFINVYPFSDKNHNLITVVGHHARVPFVKTKMYKSVISNANFKNLIIHKMSTNGKHVIFHAN